VARVLYAYIVLGIDKTDAILTASEGTYHSKIGSLPTRTTRPPKTTDGTDKKESVTLADVEKMDDKAQRTEFAKFTAKEIGNMASGLKDEQIPVLLHALTLRLKASKDKAYKALGNKLGEWMDADAIANSLAAVNRKQA